MCAWVHAASISGASRRRRRQSVAAPPSAPAITPPALTPFARFSRSPSASPPFPLRFARSSLYRDLALSLSSSLHLSPPDFVVVATVTAPFLAFSTGAPEICENHQGAISPSFPSFSFPRLLSRGGRVVARIFLPTRHRFWSFYFFFCPSPTTRARHVPYCWCRAVSRER